MSSRGRRGRGRPPKSSYTIKNKVNVNFLKPRYLRTSSGQGSRSSTPVNSGECRDSPTSDLYSDTSKHKIRELTKKNKSFIHDFKYFDRNEESEDDLDQIHSSDDDEIEYYADGRNDSDISCLSDDNFSVVSQSSLSTVGSTPVKRKYTRRNRDPIFLQDREIPTLTLPQSSEDLLLTKKYAMCATGVYEIMRHFRHIIRLSPFTFEDFCACLLSDEQSILLAEIHIQLLKAIIREEDANNTWFGPHDVKDSVNVQMLVLDSMTWPEVLRNVLGCDIEFKHLLKVFQEGEYPFTTVNNKLKVCLFILYFVIIIKNLVNVLFRPEQR